MADPNEMGTNGMVGRSVRDQFIAQSVEWIKQVAAELPDEVLSAAMSDEPGAEALMHELPAIEGSDQTHPALILRAIRAITHIVRQLPNDLSVHAVAASSDIGALARIMSDPRVFDPSREADPLSGAVGRSIEHRRRLLKMAGEMLSSSQVAETLRIKRHAVDKRRNAGSLLAVRMGPSWFYPAFQFGKTDVLPGIKTVLGACQGSDPWVVIDILLAPDDVLGGRTLLDAIREGDEKAVARFVAQTAGDGAP
ncbi:DNA-binding protein [Ruegeria sediminis]|uniref:DNA-binding protein n=1 Tax=Ruegeria sediminis TaxID=2583820 RepID=A0ABY2WUI6_9RHOB|nr:DNA-binding protein [Ruegeria sediminis]TMV05676.1 DNA-binding protein [Ruegeria sediminis]